jgi:putative ABC transport system permease protein
VIGRLGLGVALRALWAHRFRSLLTALSVLLGCAAIVFMSSLAKSGFATLRKSIEDMGGARLLLVAPREPERAEKRARSYERGLTEADAERVFGQMPHVLARSLYASLGTKDVMADNGSTARADLLAADEELLGLYGWTIASGRAFDEDDVRTHAPACVVGHSTARTLWPEAAVGRLLSIAGVRCRVVGVLSVTERPGVQLGFDWQKVVLMPRTTAIDRLAGVRESSLLIVKMDRPESNDLVKRIANVLLESRRHGIDDFTFFDFQRILSRFYQVFTLMEVLTGCLAGIALFIGGIGIMNMMLVSVTERTREVGIRKALGASPRDIQVQFLLEAAAIALVAGLIGVALGLGLSSAASALISHFMGAWVASISAEATLIALASALSVGIVFGWLPARQASSVPPAEAMRA